MRPDPIAITRFGALGQIGTIALAVIFWSLGLTGGVYATCIAYLVVTIAGIVGIARTESTIVGPLVYPFVLPGLVPLYYFATR
ncbi:hypothetical protein [Halalkalicoccus jeotgali]|uniref:Uncharacterized protein n=1 Tax=Halalkalicoccus jeotgali (strain DSM 18796 / CECT 7217 / JCM 14584 / KCTC 4019 / B3) TaxID=795797 RepID=D8J7B5_HALJB|nr:hypothetical protein [Halalkalicoccus jeotgali]ADJ14010.1 hypothetical protein HacjB3_03085 [Halalkalicoccus jeotgali B3]ELY33944.1 hypothetical protein C497_16222 [Halalkalicoccus jeotgali B3]